MQRIGITDRKCATCRWWQGNREIFFWNRKPFKVDCDNLGDCPALRATNKAAASSCSHWVKWEKLP